VTINTAGGSSALYNAYKTLNKCPSYSTATVRGKAGQFGSFDIDINVDIKSNK